MKTKNDKQPRRRGLLAAEIAQQVDVSLYKAKQTLKLLKEAPELVTYVMNGELKLKQAIEIARDWPELITYVVAGKLRGAHCDRVLRQLRSLAEPEVSFEESVMRDYLRWLSKFPKADRKEVHEIIEWIPAAKLADVMPSQEAEKIFTVENERQIVKGEGK